jgi:transposase
MMQQRNRYSPAFKKQAVELVHTGKPVSEVAEELAIGSGLLYRWVGQQSKKSEAEQHSADGNNKQFESNELRKMQKEITRLKLENDILKKAAVILGINHSTPVVQ